MHTSTKSLELALVWVAAIASFLIAQRPVRLLSQEVSYVLQEGQPGSQVEDVTIPVDPRLSKHNLGAAHSLGIWQDNGVSLIRFDLSSIPRTARVKSAALELFCISVGFSQTEIERSWPVHVYACNHEWKEGTGGNEDVRDDGATMSTFDGARPWPNGQVTASAGELLATVVHEGSETRWYKWSLKSDVVQEWLSGKRQNHGLMVWGRRPGKAVSFASSETPTVHDRPILRITIDSKRARVVHNDSAFRIWTDNTNEYTVDARLLESDESRATLERRDGKIIHVPISRLSKSDQAFIVSAASTTWRRLEELTLDERKTIYAALNAALDLDLKRGETKYGPNAYDPSVFEEFMDYVDGLQKKTNEEFAQRYRLPTNDLTALLLEGDRLNYGRMDGTEDRGQELHPTPGQRYSILKDRPLLLITISDQYIDDLVNAVSSAASGDRLQLIGMIADRKAAVVDETRNYTIQVLRVSRPEEPTQHGFVECLITEDDDLKDTGRVYIPLGFFKFQYLKPK